MKFTSLQTTLHSKFKILVVFLQASKIGNFKGNQTDP